MRCLTRARSLVCSYSSEGLMPRSSAASERFRTNFDWSDTEISLVVLERFPARAPFRVLALPRQLCAVRLSLGHRPQACKSPDSESAWRVTVGPQTRRGTQAAGVLRLTPFRYRPNNAHRGVNAV